MRGGGVGGVFFFSSRRRHTRFTSDWSSDVCSSDLSTKRFGLRRISRKLANNGFGVLKLNLRGSGSARYLAKGNYCARCSSDVISAINYFKKFINLEFKDLIKMNNLPIYGVGLSLGGTILLNACLDYDEKKGEKLDRKSVV